MTIENKMGLGILLYCLIGVVVSLAWWWNVDKSEEYSSMDMEYDGETEFAFLLGFMWPFALGYVIMLPLFKLGAVVDRFRRFRHGIPNPQIHDWAYLEAKKEIDELFPG